jgi:hypothetical protein
MCFAMNYSAINGRYKFIISSRVKNRILRNISNSMDMPKLFSLVLH